MFGQQSISKKTPFREKASGYLSEQKQVAHVVATKALGSTWINNVAQQKQMGHVHRSCFFEAGQGSHRLWYASSDCLYTGVYRRRAPLTNERSVVWLSFLWLVLKGSVDTRRTLGLLRHSLQWGWCKRSVWAYPFFAVRRSTIAACVRTPVALAFHVQGPGSQPEPPES